MAAADAPKTLDMKHGLKTWRMLLKGLVEQDRSKMVSFLSAKSRLRERKTVIYTIIMNYQCL